jgi:hypothetical protein
MKKDNWQEPSKAKGRQGRSLIPFAIAILVVLGLVFSGWGTVYAAQDSEPDDLLYPVKVAVDYLDDLFTVAESDVDLEPSTIGERDGIQIHDRDRLQGMTGPIDGKGNDLVEPLRAQERIGQINLDLPVDDTLTTTPTITATRMMSGSLWGPGPCFGGPENCELDLTAPHGYTYTHGVDDEAPFQGTPPVTDPVPSLGPGESPVKEVQEPAGNTGTTGGQKKGGK